MDSSLYIVLCLLVALYASKTQIEFPAKVRKLLKNTVVQVVMFSLLAILLNKQPHVAVIVSIILVVTFEHISKQENKENFEFAKIALEE